MIEKMRKITVIVPVYQQIGLLPLTLRSIKTALNYLENIGWEGGVLVADDCSEQWRSEVIVSLSGLYGFDYIRNDKNMGFGQNVNNAVRGYVSSDFFVSINSDCVISPNTLSAIVDVFLSSDEIALVSVPASHAVHTQVNMMAGANHVAMSRYMEKLFSGKEAVQDSITAEGHCLAVRTSTFVSHDGFSDKYGKGYGEETDLHMRIIDAGLRSVIAMTTYVFHHGKYSFGDEEPVRNMKKKNFNTFQNDWGGLYQKRVAQYENAQSLFDARVSSAGQVGGIERVPDITMFLPGISAATGGVAVAVELLHNLASAGLDVLLFVDRRNNVKPVSLGMLSTFPLNFRDIDFISTLKSGLFITTHVSTHKMACEAQLHKNAPVVPFVQGDESMFDAGEWINDCAREYSYPNILTSSAWLRTVIVDTIPDRGVQGIESLQICPSTDQFCVTGSWHERCYDILMVIRGAPDKGQTRLFGLLSRLKNTSVNVAIVCSASYQNVLLAANQDWRVINGSMAPAELSKLMNQSKIYVDLSGAEGMGLLPLEAWLCGCEVIVADNGGVNDIKEYIRPTVVSGGSGCLPDVVSTIKEKIKIDSGSTIKYRRDVHTKLLLDSVKGYNGAIEVVSKLKKGVHFFKDKSTSCNMTHTKQIYYDVIENKDIGSIEYLGKTKLLFLRVFRVLPRPIKSFMFRLSDFIIRTYK